MQKGMVFEQALNNYAIHFLLPFKESYAIGQEL